MKIRLGCSGWSYSDWVGPFYPKETRPQDFLRLYSQVFDCVEIDSTFYRAPATPMVRQWYNSTPSDFTFAPKLPKRITHDQHLENVSSYMDHFVKTISLLHDKLGPFVIQLPPSFKHPKHEKQFTNFINDLNPEYRYAVEFRHRSWFNPEVEQLLKSRNICQVWSVNQYLTTPTTVCADFIYLRFVGDRSINEFNKLQKDQTDVMKTWNKALQDVGESVRESFVFFNNHFAGFGPASVNEFRRLMGLMELNWSHLKDGEPPQKTILDFSALS